MVGGLPLPLQNGTKLGVHFFLKLFTHLNTKSASKKYFIIGLQNYQLVSTANAALMGPIGHAC